MGAARFRAAEVNRRGGTNRALGAARFRTAGRGEKGAGIPFVGYSLPEKGPTKTWESGVRRQWRWRRRRRAEREGEKARAGRTRIAQWGAVRPRPEGERNRTGLLLDIRTWAVNCSNFFSEFYYSVFLSFPLLVVY